MVLTHVLINMVNEAHDAIVIDGREALVMKAGSAPLTRTR